MIIAKRCLVSGRVQGVGFRFFVQERAAVEGLHGWVRNLPDGRVEAWLEGDDESVTRVERAIQRGPAGAHVEHVIVEEVTPARRATGFSIRGE
jgi:acylphosphatase